MQQQTIFPGTGTTITAEDIQRLDRNAETPFYLYDESLIRDNCIELRQMPGAYWNRIRYAMKANSSLTLLKIINEELLWIDASSLNEVRIADIAGIPFNEIMLTTQEVPEQEERRDLEGFMKQGLRYNACSLRQLELVSDFVAENNFPISVRVHPGEGGSGESQTRDTANPYSCFGIHIKDLTEALELARKKGVVIDAVHDHIGSGGSPEKWAENISRLLSIVEDNLEDLPDLAGVSFGGGLKVGRMPGESFANLYKLGDVARNELRGFRDRTGKKLYMEIEPGTYVMAMAGNIVTKVIDKKSTDKVNFIVLDGGMEVNPRPALYGSKHPFAVVSQDGELKYSDWDLSEERESGKPFAIVGRCCESGDSQTIDSEGNITPRMIAEPEIGDYLIIGGAGAYCPTMGSTYNAHPRPSEWLKRSNGDIHVIRTSQPLVELLGHECPHDL